VLSWKIWFQLEEFFETTNLFPEFTKNHQENKIDTQQWGKFDTVLWTVQHVVRVLSKALMHGEVRLVVGQNPVQIIKFVRTPFLVVQNCHVSEANLIRDQIPSRLQRSDLFKLFDYFQCHFFNLKTLSIILQVFFATRSIRLRLKNDINLFHSKCNRLYLIKRQRRIKLIDDCLYYLKQ